MRRGRAWPGLTAGLALGLAGAPSLADPPAGAGTAPAAVRSGVTTHFSQGWPARLMDDAAAMGAVTVRDSVHWAKVELAPGQLVFTEANSGHVGRACAAGMTVLLGLEPRNPLYDGGQTIWSPTGQAAFARYVRALADRWPRCVVAVEVGNEINGAKGMTGPAAALRARAHVGLVKAVHLAVKPAHPGLVLLGGSTNTIATGFLARLFAGGLLDWADAIAVHPYRAEPEGLDAELGRVIQAMRRAGRVRPIWATEFSRDFPDPALAPAFYLKSAALMESAGVADHFWYALADQPGFPTMGLERLDGTRKPAGRAFAFAARALAPLGPAQRVGHGDAMLVHLRYSGDAHVVWGAPRALFAPPGARAFAADGSPVPVPARISEVPVVIRSAPALGFGPAEVLADSLHDFGEAIGGARGSLAWFARRADGTLLPLAPVDWDWTSYLGHPALPGFAANPGGIGTAPGLATVVRYVAPAGATGSGPAPVTASLCLAPTIPGMRAEAMLVRGGQALWRAPVGPRGPVQATLTTALVAGERLDLVLSPLAGGPAARFRYRLRIARGATAEPAPC
ncbi:hypothetical protein ACFOD9_04445 [Novosphingobium bradum]|uniref:Asl1-like glycosyl hydrolase catalytic domain-containing protein n=1 Tax=Novosphingobium bradum TaxID=1737444 RepID=A0ABV7ILL0_9SPHN